MNAPFRPPVGLTSDFTVELHSEIEAAERSWRALESVPGSGTIFQHFDVMRLWYRAAAGDPNGTAVIAVVKRADTQRPVALFPMVRRRRGLVAWLELADGGVLDYCQPLLAPDEVDATNIQSVIAALARSMPGDVLYINKVPDRLGGRANPLATLPQRARLMLSSWSVPLADDAYARVVQERQSSNYKGALRRKTRKLEREHTRTVELTVGSDMTEWHYRLLRDMRTAWFVNEGRSDGLSNERWEGFYRGLALGEGGAARPWLSRIDCDGETVAVLFGLVDDQGAVALMPASQRGEWAKYAPGTQLFEATMQKFTTYGAPNIDLSIGDNPYKLYIGADAMPLYDLLIPKTLVGKVLYKLWRLKVLLRNSPLMARLRAKHHG